MIAILKSAVQGDASWTVLISYDNGQTKQHQISGVSDDVIRALAREDVAAFDAVTSSAGKVTIQPGDSIDLTPPIVQPVVPDPARDAFFAGLSRLRNLVLILPAADKRITDLQALLAPQVNTYL